MREILFGAALLLSPVALSRAEETRAEEAPATTATEFTSKEGGFSVRLPGKPAYEKTTVGKAKEPHHMFSVGTPQGVYLISYQDNPNLEGATPKGLAAALESGRDLLLEKFAGKLIESQETKLDKKHPGLAFRLTIPAAKGEARCRYYLVGTRLYQAMALGTPEFAGSDEATRTLDSFKLLSDAE